MVITAHSSMPDTLAEVMAKAKREPDLYSYATYGVGSSTHLAGEMFMNDTGVSFRHIPYKGVEAVTALAGGQVNLMVDRSEGRRVGKECVSACRSRWAPYH